MTKSDKAIKYWATEPITDIAYSILDKVEDYYKFLRVSGRLDLYKRAWAYYFRQRLTQASLQTGGEQGELTTLSMNHYRNLLAHLETMTTSQRIAFEAKATNTDVKSQAQTILATSLLDYYMREKKLDRVIVAAVKEGLIFGEAFVRCEWDVHAGDEYGSTATGAPVYAGDIKYTNYNTLNVVRDYTKQAPGEDKYVILRDFVNKFDLAAQYPDLEKRILEDCDDAVELSRTTTVNYIGLDDSDNIPVYTLLHEPTPSVPMGRYTQVLTNGTVLLDGPLPYKEAHVYRIAPDEENGTIFGYTVGFDILPIQQSHDILSSSIISNQATFGVQNVLVPKGADLSVSQLAGGMNMVEFDAKQGEIKALNLTQTPPEIFNFLITLEKEMETISGVNSVARGNPEASLQSGSALALVQSMALQFNQNLQRAYIQLVEDVGTGTINILKEYAAVPRVAAITGKSNRPLMREFTGDDLKAINRVTVDAGNPLQKTAAGKTQMAENLLGAGFIENPDQYIQVLNTGTLQPVIEGKTAQLLLMRGENEALTENKPVRALITDDHAKHIQEHMVILSNPEIRMDPSNPVLAATLAHIQEHMGMLQNPMTVQLHMALQGQAMPTQAQVPTNAGPMNPELPVEQQAENVNMPAMPSPPQNSDPATQATIEAMSEG